MAADPVWLCVEAGGHQRQTEVGTEGRGLLRHSASLGAHPASSHFSSRGEDGPGRWDQVQLDSLSSLLHRLLDDAMSGKYLHDGFTLPCPPGLRIPEEVGYTITPNTLKVLELSLTLEVAGG